MVDRGADVLELLGAELNKVSPNAVRPASVLAITRESVGMTKEDG
jgi:hypothetical protein